MKHLHMLLLALLTLLTAACGERYHPDNKDAKECVVGHIYDMGTHLEIPVENCSSAEINAEAERLRRVLDCKSVLSLSTGINCYPKRQPSCPETYGR